MQRLERAGRARASAAESPPRAARSGPARHRPPAGSRRTGANARPAETPRPHRRSRPGRHGCPASCFTWPVASRRARLAARSASNCSSSGRRLRHAGRVRTGPCRVRKARLHAWAAAPRPASGAFGVAKATQAQQRLCTGGVAVGAGGVGEQRGSKLTERRIEPPSCPYRTPRADDGRRCCWDRPRAGGGRHDGPCQVSVVQPQHCGGLEHRAGSVDERLDAGWESRRGRPPGAGAIGRRGRAGSARVPNAGGRHHVFQHLFRPGDRRPGAGAGPVAHRLVSARGSTWRHGDRARENANSAAS